MDLYRRFALFKYCLYKYHLVEILGLYCCVAIHVAYLCLVGDISVCFFERENIWQANARLAMIVCGSFLLVVN